MKKKKIDIHLENLMKAAHGFSNFLWFAPIQKSTLGMEVNNIIQYINESFNGITEIQKKFEIEVEKAVKENRDEDFDEYEVFGDRQEQYHKTYPNLFYSSMLIYLYSFLENKMKEIADHYSTHTDLNVKPDDFNGRGVDRYHRYFIHGIGIELDGIKATWDLIDRYRQIRNLIVHNQSKYKVRKVTPAVIKGMKVITPELYEPPVFMDEMNFLAFQKEIKTFEITHILFLADFLGASKKYLTYIYTNAIEKAKGRMMDLRDEIKMNQLIVDKVKM